MEQQERVTGPEIEGTVDGFSGLGKPSQSIEGPRLRVVAENILPYLETFVRQTQGFTGAIVVGIEESEGAVVDSAGETGDGLDCGVAFGRGLGLARNGIEVANGNQKLGTRNDINSPFIQVNRCLEVVSGGCDPSPSRQTGVVAREQVERGPIPAIGLGKLPDGEVQVTQPGLVPGGLLARTSRPEVGGGSRFHGCDGVRHVPVKLV
jgi:hypothetical protein